MPQNLSSFLSDEVSVNSQVLVVLVELARLTARLMHSAYAIACSDMQVDVYDGTADFLRTLDLDEDALTKAVIGTIGDIDSYQLPDAKGYTAFMRHLLGVSDEERQQRRDQILGTTLKDFRSAPPSARLLALHPACSALLQITDIRIPLAATSLQTMRILKLPWRWNL